jgi:anti-anti-sigma factor
MTPDGPVAQPSQFLPNGRITTTVEDDWHASIALVGEFDAANSGALRAAMDSHLDAGRRVLRLDTAGVSFMDSSAVGAIVHAHARCHDEHGSLIITGVQPRIARLFEITGLDHVLLIDTADVDDPGENPPEIAAPETAAPETAAPETAAPETAGSGQTV